MSAPLDAPGPATVEPAPADGWELADDRFWLSQGAHLLTGSSASRVQAASQLMSALSWLWTVYTGVSVIGALSRSESIPTATAWALASPSVVIVIAYAAAVYAFMPLTVAFDPRDPDDIRVAHQRAVRSGWIRLRLALVLAGLAAVSIAGAIATAILAG